MLCQRDSRPPVMVNDVSELLMRKARGLVACMIGSLQYPRAARMAAQHDYDGCLFMAYENGKEKDE